MFQYHHQGDRLAKWPRGLVPLPRWAQDPWLWGCGRSSSSTIAQAANPIGLGDRPPSSLYSRSTERGSPGKIRVFRTCNALFVLAAGIGCPTGAMAVVCGILSMLPRLSS